MTKHSKNNTASSVFSYAEYKRLDYGTKRQRLGNESMRRFDACSLCLQRVRDPVVCHEGHLFCKECVYTDLLTQKKDIKKQKDRLEQMKRETEEEKERAKEAARERVLLEFERGQLGLGKSSLTGLGTASKEVSQEPRGVKRKFEFDASTVETLTREAEEAALLQIEREQAERLRAKLPDFWLPSLTPTYTSHELPNSLKDIKVQTTCRSGEPRHSLSLKNLIPVQFTFMQNKSSAQSVVSTPTSTTSTETSKPKREDNPDPICPSCKRILSNSIIMYLMKQCSHVVCKTCTDSLIRPSKQCVVCDKELGDKDIIELRREGTGFAGGGIAETRKPGIAFQG
ncbi:hypothetical protein NEOLEDRAFT_273488 [Neolentinus lepideus HHB14362 ss-1]|uniref:RING-type domain-containing protein n=1 Tax=Neolentinus lepideus HHB14362 ss-1 TaxID=1314782 RepID=A0A165T549_9AGAM|nr:hypothetical protein NEOLEDRAFT_273488 [Neolentinus lepideus HHB14362 ss-1]